MHEGPSNHFSLIYVPLHPHLATCKSGLKCDQFNDGTGSGCTEGTGGTTGCTGGTACDQASSGLSGDTTVCGGCNGSS